MTMEGFPLNINTMLQRANRYFPNKEIVSLEEHGKTFRYTYRDYYKRVCKLANVLKKLGLKQNDRVATLAWNNFRHLELYFAVTCFGAVLHTVNVRLSDEHIKYILNHAEDKVIFVDPDLLPILENIASDLKTVKKIIVLAKNIPKTTLRSVYCYEDLLAEENDDFDFKQLDENSPAGMCFTSATTGNPKGVVYTHRSIYLHSAMLCQANTMAIQEMDVLLPIVPMFHVNAWGIPFAGLWMGATIVLPGQRPKAEDILKLIESERVTFTAAAVTVGIDMLKELKVNSYDISSLRALMLGGQSTPLSVIWEYQQLYNVPIFTAWGATETSPIATTLLIRSSQQNLSVEEKMKIPARQGVLCPGLEMKIINEEGNEVQWNDKEMGEIYVRGPWVATSYFQDDRTNESFKDGWWKSGDIATINEDGVIRLVDRVKDLIKSGGEWISSVELENELMAHEAVLEAVVVGIPHEKWQERPVACVVLKENQAGNVSKEDMIQWLEPKFAKWWLPDEVIFMENIPKTGVGKFNKKLLREMIKEKSSILD
jgi:fatty-acyl-CoA synthase